MRRALPLAFLAAAGSLSGAPSLRRSVSPRVTTPADLAASDRSGTRLLLHAAVFDPLSEAPDFASVGLPPGSRNAYAIVQFFPGQTTQKELLEAQGVRFLGYVPDNAFLVRLSPGAGDRLAKNAAVRWTGPWEAGFKVHARLWPGSTDAATSVTVVFFPGAALLDEGDALVAAAPGAVRISVLDDALSPRLRFSIPAASRAAFVRAASLRSEVAWVEPYDPPRLLTNDSLGPIQSNDLTALLAGACASCTIFGHGLTGTGQILALSDTGNDSDMCFFRKTAAPGDVTDADLTVPPAIGNLYPAKKLIGYWVQPGASAYDDTTPCGGVANAFHGTHTSAIAVGDNYTRPSTPSFPGIDTGDGMAPNAQLLFQDIGDTATGCLTGLGDLKKLFQQARDGGARIHSNSWGSTTNGAYTSDDQSADRFLFDNEQMAIFFAVGNSGSASGTTLSPANAKDVVAVGAMQHGASLSLPGFTSRGPTADGRIKPDLMAPGVSINSARGDPSHSDANCSLQTLSGTSMACPTAAGGAALLRQYFVDGFYPSGTAKAADRFEPLAPLVKAVLLNGTLPLPAGGAFGNGDYGWGRVFLDNNLFFAGDARGLRVFSLPNESGLATGDVHTYSVTVGAGQELRATLAWSDPEATLGTGPTLVNDLDLTASDGATTYLGNVLNASGVSVAGGAKDGKNTVEQLRLVAPAAATYTFTVSGTLVPGAGRAGTSRQGYALAVSAAACATAVTAAPQGLAATDHPVMGVDLTFAKAGGSATTQLYRAAGGCSAPAQSFQLVGTSAGTAFTDARAQGGVTYGYVARGADGCGEGPASACAEITPSGRCDITPAFTGLSSVVSSGTQCRSRLAWSSAASRCPAGPSVRYNVYKGTTPSFVPAPGNLLATVTGLAYDDDAVTSGQTYYYVVRAEDTTVSGGSGPHGGNEETNTAVMFASALGPPGASGTFQDGAGDGNAFMTPEAPWQVTGTLAQAGTFSYHSGADGGTYSSNLCAALTSPALSLGLGPVLTYWARFNAEYQWDGTVAEISTDGGISWTDLPPDGGYPDALGLSQGNGCGYPASQGAFTGPSGNAGLSPWTQVQTSLGPAYDNQTVKIRWRFTSDSGVEYQGMFLDAISITNVNLPGSCTAPPSNTAPSFIPVSTPPTRRQGSPSLAGTLGTVSDSETPAGSLGVTATSVPAGISVSSLLNAGGTVTALVGAGCTAALGGAPVGLQVMDGSAATTNASATVTVLANTPPALGTYPAAFAQIGGGTTVTPSAAPSDNGAVVSLVASAPAFTGTLAVDPATGIVAVGNAGPPGTHTVTVTATDNCGAAAPATFALTVGATSFFTVPPCRIVDTRDPDGPRGGPPLAGGGTRDFVLTNVCGIPPTAVSVAANVTAVVPTGAGQLVVYPAGQTLPTTSTISFGAGKTRANNALLQLGAAGSVSVTCTMGPGQSHFIVDVVGYFE